MEVNRKKMGKRLEDVLPPVDELINLEPEEIGTFLLDFLCEIEEQKPGRINLNSYNFTLADTIKSYAGSKTEEAGKAIMEAWCWLEREGMLARIPNESTGTWQCVTRKGFKYRNKPDLETYKKGRLLPRENLDSRLLKNIYSLFVRGDYDTAVFQAFKEVEVRVRKKAGLSDDLIGINLMREAFHPERGKLTDMEILPAERQSISDLFAGSIGSFKNPSSHREVKLNNPSEAAEIILFANYLLRLVDRSRSAVD